MQTTAFLSVVSYSAQICFAAVKWHFPDFPHGTSSKYQCLRHKQQIEIPAGKEPIRKRKILDEGSVLRCGQRKQWWPKTMSLKWLWNILALTVFGVSMAKRWHRIWTLQKLKKSAWKWCTTHGQKYLTSSAAHMHFPIAELQVWLSSKHTAADTQLLTWYQKMPCL